MCTTYFTVQVDRKVGGRTALHCAAVTSNTELVKLLIEFGAGKEMEVGHLKIIVRVIL